MMMRHFQGLRCFFAFLLVLTGKDIAEAAALQGAYLNPIFTERIDKSEIKIVLEVGSRDALDAIALSEHYHTHVYAFECNPEAIKLCKSNLNDEHNVTLETYACWKKSGVIPFYPVVENVVNPGGSYNLGASSCYEVQPGGPEWVSRQTKIEVQAIRLDEWMEKNEIDHIDLLCMDTQGATLPILQGLGQSLCKIKYIITEADTVAYYSGEALYGAIKKFLEIHGFKEIACLDGCYKDVLFKNMYYKD